MKLVFVQLSKLLPWTEHFMKLILVYNSINFLAEIVS